MSLIKFGDFTAAPASMYCTKYCRGDVEVPSTAACSSSRSTVGKYQRHSARACCAAFEAAVHALTAIQNASMYLAHCKQDDNADWSLLANLS